MTNEEEQIIRRIISEELQTHLPKKQVIASELLTVAEAAQYLNIGNSTLRRWIDENKIAFILLPGKMLRVRKQWLDGWVDKRTVKAKNRY